MLIPGLSGTATYMILGSYTFVLSLFASPLKNPLVLLLFSLGFIVSAILMGAATYTAKQASNSRKDEVYYRKQELELASIDVYLENMEPENREEIKKTLSIKMFGQAQNTYTNKYDDKKGFSVDDVIKIIESLKNKIQ